MRQALSLKSSNATSQSTNLAKNVPPPGGGKLTRQLGSSNLRREMLPDIATKVEEPVINTNVKENFEVFEDPDVDPGETSEKDTSNNLIYDLERKMEKKNREEDEKNKEVETRSNFLLLRDTTETMSVCSEAPSERMSVTTTYDDDDCDKASVASSTYTTIRASFSSLQFDRHQRAELEAARAAAIKKKADKEERDNAMFTSEEYFNDIYQYMIDRQMSHRASAKYMMKQAEVDKDMREILIDWFHDVVKEYCLQKETFHLAVSLVDRVMSFLSVDKVQLQLVGTTALMIASKYEEIFPPETQEYAIITDHTYRITDILKMERYLLCQLKYVVSTPTAVWFGTCFAKRLIFCQKMNSSLDYLLDLSLVDIEFLAYKPSHIAAAACCFVNMQYEMEMWPQKIVDDTGIHADELSDILKDYQRLYICASTSNNKSIYNKYCELDQKEVALLRAPTKELKSMFPETFKHRKSSRDGGLS